MLEWPGRSDANCKPDLPLSRHLRSMGHHDSFGKLKVTILTITPSGMIKADRKGKASGLENLSPYHRMESMRKSNILSWLLFLLVSSSRIRTYSLLYWPKVYIPHCGGPFFWMSLGIIPFSKVLWQCYLIHLPIMSHFYFYF